MEYGFANKTFISTFQHKVQGVLYDVAVSTKFELCIVVTILLNMVTMAVEHYNQTDTVTDVLKILNVLFTVIFTLEAVVKIIGLRLHYFRIGWNVFDFIVVILSLLGKNYSSLLFPQLVCLIGMF